MKRKHLRLVLVCAIATVGIANWPASAAPPTAPVGQEQKPPVKDQAFHGKIVALDLQAKTITVDGKVLHVTDATKITKKTETIKLTDLKTGDDVHGTSRLAAGGANEAVTIKSGPIAKEKNPDKL